jgi:hypothetical protein
MKRIMMIGLVASVTGAIPPTAEATATTPARVATVRTVVACLANTGAAAARVKPRSCTFFKAGEPQVGDYYAAMTGLKWNRWGQPSASAIGVLHGNMGFQTTATLHFSQLRFCAGRGEQSYTRITSNVPGFGFVSMPLDRCP